MGSRKKKGPFEMSAWLNKKETTPQKKAKSVRAHEEDAAALLSSRGAARRRPGSGANPNAKGDAVSNKDLGECKQTEKASFSLKRSVLAKIQQEAENEGKKPFVHIRFKNVESDIGVERDWVVIPAWWFRELLEQREGER
jgi:Holliday junction resolvase